MADNNKLLVPLHVKYIQSLDKVGKMFESILNAYTSIIGMAWLAEKRRPELPLDDPSADEWSLLGSYGVMCDGT